MIIDLKFRFIPAITTSRDKAPFSVPFAPLFVRLSIVEFTLLNTSTKPLTVEYAKSASILAITVAAEEVVAFNLNSYPSIKSVIVLVALVI